MLTTPSDGNGGFMRLDNEMMSHDGRGKNTKVYYCKNKEHTMTKQAPQYGTTGELRVKGETVQFREHIFRTNLKGWQKYIEESDDYGKIIFDNTFLPY